MTNPKEETDQELAAALSKFLAMKPRDFDFTPVFRPFLDGSHQRRDANGDASTQNPNQPTGQVVIDVCDPDTGETSSLNVALH